MMLRIINFPVDFNEGMTVVNFIIFENKSGIESSIRVRLFFMK